MDIEDLENDLFGKPTTSNRPAVKPSLGNLDSLFGDSRPSTSAPPRRPAVSFLDSLSTAPGTAPGKSSLDDLFGDNTPAPTAPTPQREQRQARQPPSSSSLSSVLGPSRREIASAPAQPVAQPVPTAPVVVETQPSTSQQDVLRIQRLENEIERLNREIDDLKRKKKADEEELEQSWKEKLAKKERQLTEETEENNNVLLKQIAKLKGDHAEEMERLRGTYERQIESLHGSAGPSRNIESVVERVESISNTIDRLAVDVSTSSEKTFQERETTFKLKEQSLEIREQRLQEERRAFDTEKVKVFELNVNLQDMCKQQEGDMERDKWKVREEWNRLNAEKLIYKNDQKYVIEALEKQKLALEKSKTSFLKEQHDLLVRVSTERASLDQEKNEFGAKRAIDIRRLREEAMLLQRRVEAVEAAENVTDEMKRTYESKLSQLQDLEVSLMEECVEMERLRNQINLAMNQQNTPQAVKTPRRTSHSKEPTHFVKQPDSQPDSASYPQKNDSVRTVLKKHSEFLEKYIGQKVATVPPHTRNAMSSPDSPQF